MDADRPAVGLLFDGEERGGIPVGAATHRRSSLGSVGQRV